MDRLHLPATRIDHVGKIDVALVQIFTADGHYSDPSVIVAEFNIMGVAFGPAKTNAPLLVHAHAVLALPITLQRLETIAGRDPQELQTRGAVDQVQLALRRALPRPSATL